MEIKFIADNNVGKLARWLRLIGYDTLLLKEKDNRKLINAALSEGRIVLTKDTQFMKRRLVTSGKVKTILITQDNPDTQIRELVKTLNLDYHFRPFSICLECNQPLVPRSKEEIRDMVPPHVFKTQSEYTQCPVCRRVYWQGTHWKAMVRKLQDLDQSRDDAFD